MPNEPTPRPTDHPDSHAHPTPDGGALSRMPTARREELRAMFGPDAERAAGMLERIAFEPLDPA